MTFLTFDDELSIRAELEDDELPGFDLIATGVGELILKIALVELRRGAVEQTDPDGRPWAKLKSKTEARKGHALVGIETGGMISGLDEGAGQTTVEARACQWSYPRSEAWGRTHGFHNGRRSVAAGRPDAQTPRRLIGWTDEAKAQCRALIDTFR